MVGEGEGVEILRRKLNYKMNRAAGKTAQQVRVLSTKPEALCQSL